MQDGLGGHHGAVPVVVAAGGLCLTGWLLVVPHSCITTGKLCVRTETLRQVLSSVSFVGTHLWTFRSRDRFAASLPDLPLVASYHELWWVREQEVVEGRKSCEELEGERRWAAAR